MADLSGRSLGRYHLLEKLGEGGMAVVYKAFDTRLETDVAVKVIRTERLTEETKERAMKRFEREAKALARLTHPNIVKVMDFGEYEGKPYLVMPYLSGGTLKEQLGMPIAWNEAFRILGPIARALEYAHQRDIIHRDVKASNILVTDSGQPMIADFGVAKILTLEETVDLTGTGMGIGTPEYMAPEQWTGKTTERSDQYSLGVVLYEMLTGRKPYVAETPAAILLKQATEELPRPSLYARSLPEAVEKILIKALARDPHNRYEDMGAFARALENTGQTSPAPKPRERTMDQGWDQTHTGSRTKRTRTETPKPAHKGNDVKKPNPLYWVLGAGLIIFALIFFIKQYNGPDLAPVVTETPVNTVEPTLPPTVVFTATKTPLPTWTATSELGIGSTMTGEDGITLLYVPEGEFTMGSDSSDQSDEKPAHKVYLDAYWIDQTEVTNGQYAICVDAGKCTPPIITPDISFDSDYGNPYFSNYPVFFMSWVNAQSYCKWADRRLPSEAEWEKAARSTDARTFPWGNDIDQTYPNYTVRVGSYEKDKSFYGVYDMAGNVREWVADWYSESYYQNSPSSNPTGPDSGIYRVVRGGDVNNYDALRSANRSSGTPDYTRYRFGFRCARSP